MSKTGFVIEDFGLHDSLQNVLKTMERAEKSALRKGANVQKKHIRKAITSTKLAATARSSKYNDRLIDAIRSGKPKDGAIIVHIMGTRKTGSGTFRLRFFESPKVRYQTKVNGKTLKKKRKLGSLSRFNGFFQTGLNSSQAETIKSMDEQLKKYIEKAYYG